MNMLPVVSSIFVSLLWMYNNIRPSTIIIFSLLSIHYWRISQAEWYPTQLNSTLQNSFYKIPTRCNFFCLFGFYNSTCFGRSLRPSSGVI